MRYIGRCRDASLTLILLPSLMAAQSPRQASAVLSGSASADNAVVLKAGTAVQLRTNTPLSSATAKVGDVFELRVTEAVAVEGRVVIAHNARATGHVSEAQEHGRLSRAG